MTDFFDNLGGGGAPGAKLKDLNDWVQGTILDSYKRDYIPFGKKDPEKNKDGVTNRQQLVVILQTEHRNWENVNKIPLVDHNDASKGPKPPSEDDGRRAVFVTERSNLQYAVGDAITAARSQNPAAKFDTGGFLQIKITELKPTDYPDRPMKVHAVRYTPPSVAGGFFPSQEAAPSAPQAQAAPPVQQAPAAAQAQPQVGHSTPAAQDPWAAQAPAAPAADPFGGAAAGTAGNNPPPF